MGGGVPQPVWERHPQTVLRFTFILVCIWVTSRASAEPRAPRRPFCGRVRRLVHFDGQQSIESDKSSRNIQRNKPTSKWFLKKHHATSNFGLPWGRICRVNILFLCEQHTRQKNNTTISIQLFCFPTPRQKECDQMLLLWLFVDSWSHPSPGRGGKGRRGGEKVKHSQQLKVHGCCWGGRRRRSSTGAWDSTWPFGD